MTVYYVTICVIWAEALIREILQFALSEALNNNVAVLIDSSLYLPYEYMSFFIIFVSYVAMYIRLHNGFSFNRENQQCKRQGKKAHIHSVLSLRFRLC